MKQKRINIFVGHFGSGKTEVAVNYAIRLVKGGNRTSIVDLDIVNPYFRTKDAQEALEKHGIWVITPMYANTNVDVPALPPEINTLFERKDYTAVFDVGGDDIGARALSRYRDEITSEEYELFAVINTRRPMTQSAEKIEEMIADLMAGSRLQVTGLINNTNLLQDTKAENILEGQKIIEQAAARLHIPIRYISGFGEAAEQAGKAAGLEVLSLEKLISLPWDR